MADSLIRKVLSAHIGDLCMRIVIVSPLLESIKKAQVEGLKKENCNKEMIMGDILLFVKDSHGLFTKCFRV